MSAGVRTEGPLAPGGFMTVSGTAHGKVVRWIGDGKRADQLERQMENSSRLLQLLLRNAYSIEGLSPAEWVEARNLIKTEPEGNDSCGADAGEKS